MLAGPISGTVDILTKLILAEFPYMR